MRIYDVFHNNEIKASLCLQDDGDIRWDFAPNEAEWRGFYLARNWEDTRTAIEQEIKKIPHQAEFTIEHLTIRQRAMG